MHSIDQGNTHLFSDPGHLREIRRMVAAPDVTAKVCCGHSGPYWKNRIVYLLSLSCEGYQFPEQKAALLVLIDEGHS